MDDAADAHPNVFRTGRLPPVFKRESERAILAEKGEALAHKIPLNADNNRPLVPPDEGACAFLAEEGVAAA